MHARIGLIEQGRQMCRRQSRAAHRMVLACMLLATGCQTAPRNAPGTADPGLSPPNAEEVGRSTSQSVGASGGSVGTPSQSAFAAVPPGALPGNVNLSVQVTSPNSMPLQGNLLTNVYDFGPSNTTFLKSVILTLAVATPPASDQQAMVAYLDANQTWQALLDSSYNPGTGAVTATTTHFTPFTIVAFGADGFGCASQRDPDAFCDKWQLTCNTFTNSCGAASFTIGGSVHGLDGNLVLNNNLGDVVQVATDGDFTFPTGYGGGDSYVVSIMSAPQDQNCFLTGATGQVLDADVQSISVDCVDKATAPSTYPIGGVVDGLDAGDAVTLVQGNQTITVTANGDFVFPAELVLQANYIVSVGQDPVGKTCEVTQNASGTIGDAADGSGKILDIQVHCKRDAPSLSQVGGVVRGLLPGAMLVLENLADQNDVVAVAGNGNFIVSTNIRVGDDFEIVVSLQPSAQVCRVDGGIGVADAVVSWGVVVSCATPGALQFATGQSASVVVGEADFASTNQAGVIAADRVTAPVGSAYLASDGALYLGDAGAFRALIYNRIPIQSGLPADGVMGQESAQASVRLTPAEATASSGHFASISGEGNTLVAADPFDNRVLIYLQLPALDSNAAWVIGQPGLSHQNNVAACSRTGLHAPVGVVLAGGKIVIADTANHRVLIYKTVPKQVAAPADLVLGQPDFTTCTSPNVASARTLQAPQSVWTDGQRLLVADTGAHRVLVWQTFPTVVGQPADAVIGQPTLEAQSVVQGSAGTMAPTGVTSDGNSIYTSSQGFHRVEQWPFPTRSAPGPDAIAVLGQSTFEGATANACDCSTPNALGMYAPGGVSVAGTTLVVTDTGNNRYLIFASQ